MNDNNFSGEPQPHEPDVNEISIPQDMIDEYNALISDSRFVRLLLSVAKKILRDNHLAEDAVQEVFIYVWTYIEKGGKNKKGEKIKSLKAFMVRNVYYRAINILRARKRQTAFPLNPAITPAYPSQDKGDSLDLRLDMPVIGHFMWEALSALPEKLQEVILLKYGNSITCSDIQAIPSNEEIAEILKIRKTTVAARLSRAHETLRLNLDLRILLSKETASKDIVCEDFWKELLSGEHVFQRVRELLDNWRLPEVDFKDKIRIFLALEDRLKSLPVGELNNVISRILLDSQTRECIKRRHKPIEKDKSIKNKTIASQLNISVDQVKQSLLNGHIMILDDKKFMGGEEKDD